MIQNYPNIILMAKTEQPKYYFDGKTQNVLLVDEKTVWWF